MFIHLMPTWAVSWNVSLLTPTWTSASMAARQSSQLIVSYSHGRCSDLAYIRYITSRHRSEIETPWPTLIPTIISLKSWVRFPGVCDGMVSAGKFFNSIAKERPDHRYGYEYIKICEILLIKPMCRIFVRQIKSYSWWPVLVFVYSLYYIAWLASILSTVVGGPYLSGAISVLEIQALIHRLSDHRFIGSVGVASLRVSSSPDSKRYLLTCRQLSTCKPTEPVFLLKPVSTVVDWFTPKNRTSLFDLMVWNWNCIFTW